ncbi:MAG: FAD-binding protein [Deltaproteobacteria bacterium]
MHQSSSRRQFLHTAFGGIAASSIVVGFDIQRGTWLTAGAAPSADSSRAPLPHLDGTLFVDAAHLDAAQDDFGHIVHHRPVAVLLPGSVHDIVEVVRYARRHHLQVAMRGNGHSPFGQAQVQAGIVIDSSSLADIHGLGSNEAGAWLDVGPGAHWRSVIQEAFDHGLTPPVLTDFQDLSVGGTLSVGGVGATTQTFGVQADNVLELEVVTGEGDRVVCSAARRSDLFNAVLAGLGQVALIVRARVLLVAAPERVLVFNLFYDDIDVYVADQLRLLSEHRFDHLQGQVVADATGTGWRFMIEAGSYFTGPDPNPAPLLAGLHDVRSDAQSVTQSYLDYVFRLDPLVEFLISIGVWGFPHPWLDLFVPASVASSFVGDVVSSLTSADTGGGPVLFYPVNSRRIRRPFFRLPDERRCFLFSLLRTADPSVPSSVTQMLADNRDIYDRLVQVGGTRYANGALAFDARDWRRHFGEQWRALVEAKRRYDPDRILTPGQGIFP